MIYIRNTDILYNLKPHTIIIHGCNCYHVMGAGIAKRLAKAFPAILEMDKLTIKGDKNKLGTYSITTIGNHTHVANCYTQHTYGRNARYVNYEAVYKCLELIADNISAAIYPYEIRSPQIGCGLAGGDWNIIEPMFEKLLPQAKIYSL